jgi:plastocyanin
MRRSTAFFVSIASALAALSVAVETTGQTSSGSIEGRVTFAGMLPPTTVTQNGGSQPVLYVDSSGGLRYAVVYLPDAPKSAARPGAVATVNQRNFIFEPQVLAIRAGQTVRFTNNDVANHNVRAQDSNPANTFSISTAPGSIGPARHRFASMSPERPVQLSCDIHSWMAAWIYAFEHDQFAVTAADGRFRIPTVPAGRYRVAVRQPSGRLARDLAVAVRAGETKWLDVQIAPADLDMPR